MNAAAPPSPAPPPPARGGDPDFVRRRAPMLGVIIAVKLGKALLLVALALGLYSLLGDDLSAEFDRFIRWVRLDPETEFFAELERKLGHVTPANLRWLASGTLLYSLLLIVESAGLMMRAWWAVWMAIGETAFFIPIEVFDLIHRFTWLVFAILALNVFIVWYLSENRQRLFHHHLRHHH